MVCAVCVSLASGCRALHRALHRGVSHCIPGNSFVLFWKAFLFCLVSLVSLADFISLGLEIRLLREGPSVGFSQGCIPNGNLAQTGRTQNDPTGLGPPSAWHLRAAAST